MASPVKVPTLSESEARLLSLAWHCFKSAPEVDMEKLSELSGLKLSSTKVLFGKVKRKVLSGGGDEDSPAPKKRGAPADGETPKSKGGKKAKTETADNDDDEETPVKVKKQRQKKTVVKEEEKEDSGAEEAAAAATAAEDQENMI